MLSSSFNKSSLACNDAQRLLVHLLLLLLQLLSLLRHLSYQHHCLDVLALQLQLLVHLVVQTVEELPLTHCSWYQFCAQIFHWNFNFSPIIQ